MKNELGELIETLEMLRGEKAPDIPQELVEAIIRYESRFFDHRTEAKKRIEQRVDSFARGEETE